MKWPLIVVDCLDMSSASLSQSYEGSKEVGPGNRMGYLGPFIPHRDTGLCHLCTTGFEAGLG